MDEQTQTDQPTGDDALVAMLDEAIGASPEPELAPEADAEPEPAEGEAQEAEPAQEPDAEATPEPDKPDPLAELEQQRQARLAELEQQRAAQQQAQTKTAAEIAIEQQRAEAERLAVLARTDPLKWADQVGVNKKELLDRLIKDGADPQAAEARRESTSEWAKIREENEGLKSEVAELKKATQQFQQQMVYQQDLNLLSGIAADSNDFPVLSRADPHKRLAKVYEMRDKYREVNLGSDPVRTLAQLAERELRAEAEEAARLLQAGIPGAATQAKPSGGEVPTPSAKPAAKTIDNELAAQPAGKRAPPQTDEEREAEALRILGG